MPKPRLGLISTIDPEGKWAGYPIDGETDLEPVMPIVRANFENISTGRMK